MKIKVYGFKFNKDKLPNAMKATDAFRAMQSKNGVKLGKIYRVGASPAGTAGAFTGGTGATRVAGRGRPGRWQTRFLP